jgi:hypothetical protein
MRLASSMYRLTSRSQTCYLVICIDSFCLAFVMTSLRCAWPVCPLVREHLPDVFVQCKHVVDARFLRLNLCNRTRHAQTACPVFREECQDRHPAVRSSTPDQFHQLYSSNTETCLHSYIRITSSIYHARSNASIAYGRYSLCRPMFVKYSNIKHWPNISVDLRLVGRK